MLLGKRRGSEQLAIINHAFKLKDRFTLCICMCAVMCFKVTHVKRSRCSQKFKEKKKNTTDLIPLATAWLRGRLVAVLQVTPTQLLCNACCYF